MVILLLLALMGVGYWAWKTGGEKTTLTQQNEDLTKQITDVSALKDGLQQEVDSLQNAYAALAEENQSLEGTVSNAKQMVAEKEAIIKKLKAQTSSSTGNDKNLKAQIEQLLAVKADMQRAIDGLRAENDELRRLTGQLQSDLASAKGENDALSSLNKTISEDVKRLTLSNFKASAFRVEVERKKPKATAKAGRAKRVLVSFDLTGVANAYQGLRTLYLVITDDKGTPIKAKNPIMASVTVNGATQDIQAVKSQEVNITDNQRLSFNHDLEDKLKSGFYRVAVYTDIGLLGASSFRLQ